MIEGIEFEEVRLRDDGSHPKKRRLIDPIAMAKGLVKGIIGSCIVSTVVFFIQVKTFIAVVLAAILTFLGWSTHPPKDVEDAGKKVVGKLKDEIKGHTPPVLGMAPGIHLGSPKSPEQLRFEAEQKEAERRRREQSETETLLAHAAIVKLDCDENWSLERLRVEVRAAEYRAEEEARKKPYFERADKIGLKADPSWDSKTLRNQVEEAEKELAADTDYQAERREWERAMTAWKHQVEHGPNARCPRCKNPFHTRSESKRGLKCLKCGVQFSVGTAKAYWTPPPPPKEPTPPRKNPGLLWRIFH